MIATLAILTVLLGLLVLWLLWDRAEQRATVRALETAVAKVKVERDRALGDAKHAESAHARSETRRRALKKIALREANARRTVEFDLQIANSATQVAEFYLDNLIASARCLPDLSTPPIALSAWSGDSPIFDELTRERAA
jgi:hypothetical protein